MQTARRQQPQEGRGESEDVECSGSREQSPPGCDWYGECERKAQAHELGGAGAVHAGLQHHPEAGPGAETPEVGLAVESCTSLSPVLFGSLHELLSLSWKLYFLI